MTKTAFAALLILSFAAVSCGGPSADGPRPSCPLPPPAPPEPVLSRRGPVFVYDVGGIPLAGFPGALGVDHEVVLDGVTVRVRTPPGWTPSYAGSAAWLQSDAESRARVVVHLAKNHEEDFRRDWLKRDEQDAAVRVSAVSTFESPRHPLLYTYARSDDGRSGIVYALLTDPTRRDSGVIVHGVWPAELDRSLRPIAVAIANGVTIQKKKK